MRYNLLLLLLLVMPAAEAALVTVYYTGTISSSAFPSVPAGTAISGSFTYDTSTAGTGAPPQMSYSGGAGSAQLGTESASTATSTSIVWNDLQISSTDFRDQFLWRSTAATFSSVLGAEIGSYNPTASGFEVSATTATTAPGNTLTSTALPNPFPFSIGRFIVYATYDTNQGPANAAAGGQVTFSTVPEPSSLALAGLGAVILLCRRYSGKS